MRIFNSFDELYHNANVPMINNGLMTRIAPTIDEYKRLQGRVLQDIPEALLYPLVTYRQHRLAEDMTPLPDEEAPLASEDVYSYLQSLPIEQRKLVINTIYQNRRQFPTSLLKDLAALLDDTDVPNTQMTPITEELSDNNQQEYRQAQQRTVTAAAQEGYNPSKYLSDDYTIDQLNIITRGIVLGVDPSEFDSPENDADTMTKLIMAKLGFSNMLNIQPSDKIKIDPHFDDQEI